MDNRRLLIAVALSMAVLLVWGRLFPAKTAATAPVEVVEERAEPGQAGASTGGEASVAAAVQPEGGDSVIPTVAEERAEGREEQRVVLENDFAVAELSNRGGQLISYRLKTHAAADGGVLDLVRARASGPYPFGLVGRAGESLSINEALFEVAETDAVSRQVVFRYSGEHGSVRKHFSFAESGLLKVEVEARGIEPGWALLLGPGIGNPSAKETASSLAKRGAVYSALGSFVSLPAQSAKEIEIVPGGGLAWAGLDDNYFLAAYLADSPLSEAKLVPGFFESTENKDGQRFRVIRPGEELSREQKDQVRDFALELRPEGQRLSASVFLGPKELNRLLAVGYGLDRTIELGWFRFLALPFMHALQWTYNNVVANYGWVIVLMTTLIKILLLPLTHTTMVSMGKMQELAPKIQGIRTKYASKMRDKQGRPNFEIQKKINEETMALYKAEGVNPAGGCLPMLLQLPVFIAFYNIFPASIELRQAPWLLWVKDLSAHDPIYVLPIVMGATQLAQMLMTPATGNPMQRRMLMMMPVVFTVMFLGFPAGLVLYWLTNNVLSIVQQAVYNRLKKAPSVQTA